MKFTRADRSLLAEWWFTIDRAVLAVVLAMIAAGLVLSLAASPAVAMRKGYPALHFVQRHVLFAAVGTALMLIASMLGPREVRRLALAVTLAGFAALVWVALAGTEVNGARRWLRIGGLSLQPSEIIKPGFVVLSAWLLAESRGRTDMPALAIATAMLALLAGLLLAQPDVGQTMLVALVWGALFFLAGHPVMHAALLGLGSLGALAGAYWSLEYVRRRIDRFLDPASGDNYQVDKALQSFAEGGLLGRGPGEGTVKSVLPDAHTDFVFAVIGEEFGAIACLALIGLIAFILARAFAFAWRETEPFVRLATAGLALLFALQAAINMGVNVGLVPAKGMTLPLISSGGSSGIGVSLTVGLMLALMRRRPDPAHVKKPQLRPMVERIGSGGEEAVGAARGSVRD